MNAPKSTELILVFVFSVAFCETLKTILAFQIVTSAGMCFTGLLHKACERHTMYTTGRLFVRVYFIRVDIFRGISNENLIRLKTSRSRISVINQIAFIVLIISQEC